MVFIRSTSTTNVDFVFATDVVADCVFLYHSVSFRELSKRNHFQKMIKKKRALWVEIYRKMEVERMRKKIRETKCRMCVLV